MRLNPRVTPAAITLVKSFEGLRLTAARLADGRWTVGYGHVRFARQGAHVTDRDAEHLLLLDLSDVADRIEPLIHTELNDNQFNALVAFAFNIGIDNFARSTVLSAVNAGTLMKAAAMIEQWRRADYNGQRRVIDALVRRRAAEKALFLAPPTGAPSAPSHLISPRSDSSLVVATYDHDDQPVVLAADLSGEIARAALLPEPGSVPQLAPPILLTPVLAVDDQAERAEPAAPKRERALHTSRRSAPVYRSSRGSLSRERVIATRQEKAQLVSNALPYYLFAMLGVMLFASAIWSMLREPTVANLVVGIIGVLFMAPGAGYLLVRLFAGKGESSGSLAQSPS